MSLLEHIKTKPADTDKVDLGYIDAFYERLFSPRKESASNILEIGMYQGHSILLWREYFVNAKIYGIDINPAPYLYGKDRVTQIIADAYQDSLAEVIKDEYFDIVIDDGPHTYESMVSFLRNYTSKVKSGGVMILEDIIDVSWTPRLVDLVDTTKFRVEVVRMAGRARAEHLNIQWSNGLDVIVLEKM